MSELKRLNRFGNYDQFGGYYDADEADNVIKELKAKNAQLEDDVAFWKAKSKGEM